MRGMTNAAKSPKLLKSAANGSTLVAQRRFNFTKQQLNQLPNPTNGQRAYYYDSKGPRGFGIAVSAGGRKTFILYRKINKRPERIALGLYPDLSVELGRKKAAELNGLIAKGENPAAQKRQVRDEMTLKELFLQFGEHYASQKRTWLEMQREFNVYLHAWHFRKISSIRRLDVVALQTSLKQKNGLYIANHVIRLLSSMFNRASEWGWKGENPVAHLSLFKETKRQRFLLPEEVAAFFDAVNAEPNKTIRDFIYVCLLTGGRRANVQAMAWPQIDFNLKIWTVSAAEAKGGETLTIPLLPQVLEILTRRRETATSEWVFPGSGRTGHLVEPKSAWKRILKAAGLSDLRLHDLRRTLGSWQAIMGSSLLVIGKSLGHKNASSTQIYARLSNSAVRESMEKATRALLLAGSIQRTDV
jgi:integrase